MYLLFIFVNYYIGVGKYIGKFWMKKSYNYNIIAYIYNVKLIIVLFMNNINFHTKINLIPHIFPYLLPISYIIFVDKTIYRVSFLISTPSKTTRPPTLIKTPRRHYH